MTETSSIFPPSERSRVQSAPDIRLARSRAPDRQERLAGALRIFGRLGFSEGWPPYHRS